MFRTTIRVFEYERLVVGQTRRDVNGTSVTFGPSQFDALTKFAESSRDRVLEVGHRSIRFTQHVGYLQVGDLGIEVLPKTDRHVPTDTAPWHDALLGMLSEAYSLRLLHPTNANLDVQRSSLLEVYVARFLGYVEQLLHQGLAKGYRKVQENRTSFRGRLLVAENLRRNLVQAQRVFVDHQVYDLDVLVNQVLRAALGELARTGIRGALRNRLERARRAVPESIGPLPSVDALDRLVLTRNTERYRDALEMARMILLHRSPRLKQGDTHVLALLFNMNDLWERYVARLLQRAAGPTLRVVAQDRRPFWRPDGGKVRQVKPDIAIRRPERKDPVLIADTKWKVPRRGRPAISDLKQMFVYNELYECSRSLLLYPAANGCVASSGMFETAGRYCGTRFLDLFEGGKYNRAFAIEQLRKLVAEL